MAQGLEAALNGLSDSAKAKISLEIKKAVSRQVKKELAKRRKKFAHKLIMTGVLFTCGCVLYVSSDKLVDLLTDKWVAAPPRKPSRTTRKKLKG